MYKTVPNSDRKFIDCGGYTHQSDAGAGAERSQIKLRPCTFIWNGFNPGRDTRSTLDWSICSRSAAADSFRGEFVGSQKTLRERIRHKSSRSSLRTQIAFRMKL